MFLYIFSSLLTIAQIILLFVQTYVIICIYQNWPLRTSNTKDSGDEFEALSNTETLDGGSNE